MESEKTKNAIDITISLVHWNTPELLKTCLESILTSTKNVSYEVFVADSNSSDKAAFERIADSYRSDARFVFVTNDKNIAGLAHNPLFERAKGKYFVYLCPDVQLLPGCLDALYSFLENHQEAGAVSPKFLNPDGTDQMYYRRIITPKFYFFSTFIGWNIDKYLFSGRINEYYRYDDLDVSKVSEVEQPSLPLLMFRPEALSGEPVVDPRLPTYFEDVDISKRIYDHGYKIYLVPEAQIIHEKSASFKQAAPKWMRRAYYRGLIVYFKKHHPLWVPFVMLYYFLNRVAQWFAAILFKKQITL